MFPSKYYEQVCQQSALDPEKRKLMGLPEYRPCFTDEEHFWAIIYSNYPAYARDHAQ